MRKVIEKYKKGVFVYVLLNCFALLMNVAGVHSYSFIGGTEVHYFARNSISDGIWPFVGFIKDTPGYGPIKTVFNGIFYQYGLSDFCLYIGLLIAFLIYKTYIITPKVKVPSV